MFNRPTENQFGLCGDDEDLKTLIQTLAAEQSQNSTKPSKIVTKKGSCANISQYQCAEIHFLLNKWEGRN